MAGAPPSPTRATRSGLLALAVAVALALLPAVARPARAADPLESRQWALTTIRAPEAWGASRGEGAVVAVVDSGIDRGHPDLSPDLLTGATFLECGATPCGDGGWKSGPAARMASAIDHGTHVAGVITAPANGVGIVGVAPRARLISVKVLDDQGGRFDDISRGIRWAVDAGADVVNLSLGVHREEGFVEGLLADLGPALDHARDRGVVIVAAAGNQAVPVCETPAFEQDVVCVAATDKRGARANYSNHPVKPGDTALSAPGGSGVATCGENIVGPVPRGVAGECGHGDGYREKAGTSMAAPVVAGVAALLVAQGRSREAVVDTLLATARNPTTGARGTYDPTYGHGIVDAAAAVAAPLDPGRSVFRLSGADRVETAVAVSQDAFGPATARAAVLARSDGFADALAGTPLAVRVEGPLLLTAPSSLDARAEAELRRALPPGARVHLLGGTAALSAAVEGRVRALGFAVTRHAGADRFETAVAVAESGLGGPGAVVLATGTAFTDALVAGAAAPRVGAAVLLTAGRSAHPATRTYLLTHPAGRRWAVGGPAAAAHPEATALVGNDAYDTARRVAEALVPSPPTVALASALTFPDALGGGAHAARKGAPLLLVHPSALPAPTRQHLAAVAPGVTHGYLYGGPAAVSDRVRLDAQQALAR